MGDQVFRVPVSPAQRFVLLSLSFAEGQKLQGQMGRTFRRFMRAFKLDRIRDVLAGHDDRYNGAIHRAVAPALVEITAHDLDYALKLVDVERTPLLEMVVGPLFDLLEDAKAGREVAIPEGCPAFDPTTDDWSPVKSVPAADPVEVAARRIEAMLREAGQASAADLVASGRWDVAEPQAQPTETSAPADA